MAKINRKELVDRHKIVLTETDLKSPLTVGNGKFGFTADITGLQTFPKEYKRKQPLCTLSQWGWHSHPMPEYLKGKEFKLTEYKTGDRMVGYATSPKGQAPLYNYLRNNPHRFHLGRIGFSFIEETKITDIKDIHQELDMYTGIITSKFTVHGECVEVKTCAMYDRDAVGIKVKSPLLEYGNMRVHMEFPYAPATEGIEMNAAASDYSVIEGNSTFEADATDDFVLLERHMDDTEYYVGINKGTSIFIRRRENNYEVLNYWGEEISLVVEYSKSKDVNYNLKFEDAVKSSTEALREFWEEGGMIDFKNCDDPRAKVLEDRMIKSLYITRINSCSSTPPQESGFTCNSGWWGKSHLEMHYWHTGYLPIWGRPELLEKSMEGYLKYMDKCEALAKRQGYKGIRIPKIIDNEFNESPSEIATLLIWQQPHPTMMAELIYRANPTKEILEKYFELVERTSEFMLDFLIYNEERGEYLLDSPYIPAQEFHDPNSTRNAVYELEYWHFALEIYRKWCERLGKTPVKELDEKLSKLCYSPVIDGKYPAHENCPETFEKVNIDHPSMLCAYGVLPGWRMDEQIVRNTYDKVMECWDWDTSWGWDYAVLSMCAAKLGESENAIDVLLKETSRNTYSKNGHVYQYPGLSCYIDTNGALLLALGFLAAGCDSNPGNLFPKDWDVCIEGIIKYV